MDRHSLFARALSAVLLLLSLVSVRAQEMLTSACNQIMPGDSLTMLKTEYFYAGEAGEENIWDFSGLEADGSYFIKFDTIKNNQLVGYDSQKIWKYQTAENGLSLAGYEDMLTQMNYAVAQPVLPFPLQYGQTYTKGYQGDGRYCGTHYIRTFGTTQVTADALGTLILSETDTLYNTLRVYSVNTAAIRLSKDSCRNDSDNLKQVITERYQWYARGYRYPVLETVSSSTYHDTNHIATQQYGYLCPPEIQAALSDSINEQIRREDALAAAEGSRNNGGDGSEGSDNPQRNGNKCGFTYDIHTYGSQVTINYSLDASAQIHVLVVDVMGMVYRDTQQNSPAGSNYTMNIDCSGLRRGQYIIYMNVNGTIYSSKISI